ncbi:MAG: outer membrane beta-barrel protein [Pseudomonadota bacterium]|nr:outer membrane beta-barrel protein [Pseudomonadota bacterium]
MRKMVLAAVLSSAASFSSANGFYVGADYLMLDTDLKAFGESAGTEPKGLSVKFGGAFSEYFSGEAMLGIGTQDDTVKDAGFDFELDLLIGASVIGSLPLNDVFKVYGKIGLAKIEYSDSDDDRADASGLLYGVGFAADFCEKYGVNLEYIQYPDGEYDDYEIDVETASLNLGVYRKF